MASCGWLDRSLAGLGWRPMGAKRSEPNYQTGACPPLGY
jgi:hypothetical protein